MQMAQSIHHPGHQRTADGDGDGDERNIIEHGWVLVVVCLPLRVATALTQNLTRVNAAMSHYDNGVRAARMTEIAGRRETHFEKRRRARMLRPRALADGGKELKEKSNQKASMLKLCRGS